MRGVRAREQEFAVVKGKMYRAPSMLAQFAVVVNEKGLISIVVLSSEAEVRQLGQLTAEESAAIAADIYSGLYSKDTPVEE